MTTFTAARPAAREMAVKTAPRAEVAPSQLTAEEVQALIQAKANAALEKAMAKAQQEVAEPEGWWNLFAVGPIQPIAFGGPLLPHQVIKMGEPAFVATVLFLNPFHFLAPGTSAADILANFALPYEVQYATGNLTTWTLGPANLQAVNGGLNLVPGQYVYVNVHGFIASAPGIYEMNISARILGATPPHVNAPQFAGFARAVVDIDPDLFLSPAPGLQFDQPIRFQVYP
ncbi:MAG TPA: hypothetical protein PKD53_31990 [Chloroflexaceae bacterium]|nr:hypothetical protein [Chloroflexaceae bacterium]